MAQITVKYDPSLQIESIEDMMYATNKEEQKDDRQAEVQQTKITGILTPLVKVNNILLLWDKITRFELSSTRFLPELTFTFKDDLGFTKSLDQPRNDNLVLVQIIPPFDDAYKKINLRFFIESVKIAGDKVTVFAKYNVPALYQYKLEAMGKMSTYDYLDKVAKDCGLGYASNLDGTEDEKYIYVRNTNYVKSVENEICMSGSDTCILDAWIDFHNYLILCDIYERYNALESDLKVWTMPTSIPNTESNDPVKPRQEDAIITNAIALRNSQLFVGDYTVKNNSGSSIRNGTDKVLESYYMSNNESSSMLIQDGDIKKDTFVKSVYMGEIFGDYDYFSAEVCRKAYLQKITSNTIEVALATPLLGLERGQRVNFRWYEVNELAQAIKDKNDIETNTPDVEGETTDKERITLNKSVTGQYLIIGTTIRFGGWNEGWKYILTLARPASQVNTYINND